MTTTEKQNRIAELKAEIRATIEERTDFFDALEEAENDLEIPQFHIDYLKSEIDRLCDKYWELETELESLKVTA